MPRDMEGGADGDRAFRWARPTSIALIQVAAYRTAKALGTSPKAECGSELCEFD